MNSSHQDLTKPVDLTQHSTGTGALRSRRPEYVDFLPPCNHACPAGENIQEWLSLAQAGKHYEAWQALIVHNPMPAIHGRVCYHPCEDGCNRSFVDTTVSIHAVERFLGDTAIEHGWKPEFHAPKGGKRVLVIGAGPSGLSAAYHLTRLGHTVEICEAGPLPGGMMHFGIPAYRLPRNILMAEIKRIEDMGVSIHLNHKVQDILSEKEAGNFDAVFVAVGAHLGKKTNIPARDAGQILDAVSFLRDVELGAAPKLGRRVAIYGGGNTAMDCCRTSLRLGADSVKVMARKPRQFFKASPWELKDAEHENIEIIVNHSPKAFVTENGKLTGMTFEVMEYDVDDKGNITDTRKTGEVTLPCDDVILAIGQDNAFPWIERDIGMEFDKWETPVVDKTTFESTRKGVFFGGDAAFGPLNIIWAVEHGHQAAISIHKHCMGEDVNDRLPRGLNLETAKMGPNEWSYSNDYDPDARSDMPEVDLVERFKTLDIEVELGFTPEQIKTEVERCLNCDLQTVFSAPACTECDACIDICPVNCLTITANGEEADLRTRLSAPANNLDQALYVSEGLPNTARVMVKDEDLCLHCGLCAERCPTAAWDMQKSTIFLPHADDELSASASRRAAE